MESPVFATSNTCVSYLKENSGREFMSSISGGIELFIYFDSILGVHKCWEE